MSYQGPAITQSQEERRRLSGELQQGASPDFATTWEPCMILSFSDRENRCTVLTQKDVILENIRCKQTISEVLFWLGDLHKVKNVPGILHYKFNPEDGWCEIGNIARDTQPSDATTVQRPFYL